LVSSLSCASTGTETSNMSVSKKSLRMIISQRRFPAHIKKYGVDMKKSGAGG